MKNSLEKNDKKIDIDGLRIVLKFILQLKTIRFQVLYEKVSHILKVYEKSTMPINLKEKLLDEIQ